jgi:uncharacterized membrane protein YcaP (DUF421 family)
MSLEMWWPEISVLEKMFRPLVVYLFLLIGLRLAGKRELAQLNAMDLIVLLTLSNTVQNAIIGPDNSLSGGLIGATTLLTLNYVVVRFLFSHPKVDRLIEGKGAVLVQDGKILRANMAAELITRPELEAAAHKQGFARLSLVDKAVLEPSGSMTFVGKEPSVGETRQTELTSRLDQIAEQLADIRKRLATAS